jgi:glycerol-3-phosphate dehydrogenase (NAD(P)+)
MKRGREKMTRVSVIGAGSWGTAIAKLLCENGHEVTLWAHREDQIRQLEAEKENRAKLPGVKLPDTLSYTADLAAAIVGREILVLAVPSTAVRSTAHKMSAWVEDGQIIVNLAKGIEEKTLMILTDVIQEEIPQANAAVLSGPSHAEEVGRSIPTAVVTGARDQKTAERIQNVFMGKTFRVYTSPDMLGIELGGALKNVIALAAGMADGLGCGDNTKAALITRGIAEMSRLGLAMGGHIETFNGLTGIGDLIVTCSSVHSRNRKAGYLMGQGKTMQEAMDEVQMVVEGVYSAKAAIILAKKYNVDMPIVEEVNQILFEDKPAKEAVSDLMLRDKKIEHPELPWK